jgi:CheY-like chemotaxis protein
MKAMPKVMLIEDDVSMLSLLSTLLDYEGFGVVEIGTRRNIDDVINLIQQERPDLLLIDVHIGRLNGFDLLHRLRTDGILEGIRVLMSSGMDLRNRADFEGADGFILKPYMPEDLIGKIHHILGKNSE